MKQPIALTMAYALALTGCALVGRSEGAATARELHALMRKTVGCYRLTVGPWSPQGEGLSVPAEIRLRQDTVRYNAPINRLLDSLGVVPRLMEPLRGYGRDLRPTWTLQGRDSVNLSWSSGLSGVNVRLERRGPIMVGRASTWTDQFFLVRQLPWADAVLSPTSCDGRLPTTTRS